MLCCICKHIPRLSALDKAQVLSIHGPLSIMHLHVKKTSFKIPPISYSEADLTCLCNQLVIGCLPEHIGAERWCSADSFRPNSSTDADR